MFFGCFFKIFVVFLTSLGGQFCMFFAYLFELFFAYFSSDAFQVYANFQNIGSSKHIFFLSKNVILKESPSQNNFENLDFWDGVVFCFLVMFKVF